MSSLTKRFGLAAALEEITEEAAAAAAASGTSGAADTTDTTTPPNDGEGAASTGDATPPTGDNADAGAGEGTTSEEATIPPEPVEIPLVEDTAEEAIGDANVAAADIEAAEDTISNVQEDASTLDSLADSMQASEATGGMDESAAKIAQVAVERLMERLQMSDRKTLPAMESFGGHTSKLKATRIAVENIREQVKTVMQALYNMLVKAYEFVKNFMKAALDGNQRLKKRAEELLAALEKTDGTASVQTLEDAAFAKALAIKGEVSAKGVVDGLTSTGSSIEGLATLSHIVAESMKASKEVSLLVTSAESFAGFTFKDVTEGSWEAVSDDRYGKAEEGYNYFTLKGDELPGGKTFVVYAKSNPESGQDSFDAAINTKMTIESVGEDAEVKTVPVATLEEAKAIVKGVIELCDKVEAAKGTLAEIENLQSEMAKEAKSAIAAIKDDPEAAKRAKVVQRMIVSGSTLTTKPVVLSIKFSLGLSKAALEYAAKSGKAYALEPEKKAVEGPKDGEAAAAA